VHLEELTYIDHACLELLTNWEKQHQSTGGSLNIDWQSLTSRFHQGSPVNGEARGRTGIHAAASANGTTAPVGESIEACR
jgi:hypothetical protein